MKNPFKRTEPTLSTTQAARYMTEHGCSISRFTIIRAVADGRLPATKTEGGQARILPRDLDTFIRSRLT